MVTGRWLLVGVLVGAIGAGVAGWAWAGSSPGDPPRLGAARLGTIRQTVAATGTIEPVQEADLSFGVSGQVTTVSVAVGQQVQAGQALATVDAASLPSQVAQARAAVAAQQARMVADQSSGVLPAQLNADTAALTAANAQLALAQQNLSKAALTAPFAGTVAAVNLTVGQQVAAGSAAGTTTSLTGSAGTANSATSGSTGSGAATAPSVASPASTSASNAQVVVISTGTYVVNASVDDTQVAQLRPGDQAIVIPNGWTNPIFGTVNSVGMVGNESSGVASYPVKVDITGNPPNLPIGASALVSIVVQQLTNVIVVPQAAVHVNGTTTVVYEWANGKQVAHPVTIGLSGGGQTQITSGLTPGTPIVLPAAPTATSSASAPRGPGFGAAGGFGDAGGRGPGSRTG